jgi:general secretion pathway protein I
MRSGRSGDRGFTLLEVLVAFIIAALALGELFSVAAADLRSVAVAGRYEEALSRARSHLAATGLGGTLAPGEQQGEDGGGYHWVVRTSQVAVGALPDSGASLPAPQAPRPALYVVAASVSWREGGQARSVRLTTERVAPAARTGP